MKIAWITPEIEKFSSGISNHNRLFIDYFRDHPEVEEIIVVKYPLPEYGVMPPTFETVRGVRCYTPRISMDYSGAFKSILQADLKFVERLKIRLFKLALRFKRIKRFDTEKIKKWGQIEFGLLGFSSVQLPLPNPFFEQVGQFIAKLSPDIVQSHTEVLSIAGGVAKAVAKDRIKAHLSYQVMVEEEKDYLEPRTIQRVFWERLDDVIQWSIDSNIVDTYIAASNFVKTRLKARGVSSDRVRVVNSPIVLKYLNPINKSEARTRLGIPQNKRVILSVGRMLERKRFIDIIQVLKNLPEDIILYLKRSNCSSDELVSNTFDILQKEIQKYKLENRVIINSEVLPYEQMHQVYSAADIAAFPFLYEPFGMCVAEAMAIGLPIIVYNSGYLPEFINGNGFVVEPQNLEELQEKIQILLDDPSLANEMGAKGPDLVKQYDIQVLGEKLLDIYREYL